MISSSGLWVVFADAVLVLMAIAIAVRVGVPLKPTRTGVAISLLPNLLMLVLFYSLAVHMYLSLGAWPNSIGEQNFSRPLLAHANITTNFFAILLLVTFLVWPLALFLCALTRRGRALFSYLVIYGLSYVVSWGLLLLAPSRFLDWWWD